MIFSSTEKGFDISGDNLHEMSNPIFCFIIISITIIIIIIIITIFIDYNLLNLKRESCFGMSSVAVVEF